MLSLKSNQPKARIDKELRTGKAGTLGMGTVFLIDCNIRVLPGSPQYRSNPAANLGHVPAEPYKPPIFSSYVSPKGPCLFCRRKRCDITSRFDPFRSTIQPTKLQFRAQIQDIESFCRICDNESPHQ